MAVQIVRHAILMVINNLANALKASLGPIAVGVAAGLVLALALGVDMEMLLTLQTLTPEGTQLTGAFQQSVGAIALFALLAALISLFTLSWVAVTWHRFILKEEYPAALPSLAGKPVWPYLGKSVWLAIVMIVVFIPIVLVSSLVLAPVAALSPALGGALIAVGLGLVFGYLWLRWALILPAAALGEPMSLSDSWAATRSLSGTIWSVSILVTVLNFLLGLLALPFGQTILAVIVQQAVNWFTLMVGLSILTTLYGHLVERRPLID